MMYPQRFFRQNQSSSPAKPQILHHYNFLEHSPNDIQFHIKVTEFNTVIIVWLVCGHKEAICEKYN
jgi:hypothetical protein